MNRQKLRKKQNDKEKEYKKQNQKTPKYGHKKYGKRY